MATLNIKNFPDDLYERLQERAEREHRSLAQQVIHLAAGCPVFLTNDNRIPTVPGLRVLQLEDYLSKEA